VILTGKHEIMKYMKEHTMDKSDVSLPDTSQKRVYYRKNAFKNYAALCAHCGFGRLR